MNRRRVETSLYAGSLFAVLGGIAWLSGEPFIFPSLGPSAFVLAFERHGKDTRAHRVVGGHLIGAVAGFLAYSALATGIALTTTPPPASIDGLRLATSGVFSIVLTAWGMIATDTVHAPACATTLIVSLGLLSTPPQVAVIPISVVILVYVHGAFVRLFEQLVAKLHARFPAD